MSGRRNWPRYPGVSMGGKSIGFAKDNEFTIDQLGYEKPAFNYKTELFWVFENIRTKINHADNILTKRINERFNDMYLRHVARVNLPKRHHRTVNCRHFMQPIEMDHPRG